MGLHRSTRASVFTGLTLCVFIMSPLAMTDGPSFDHTDQDELLDLVQNGQGDEAFEDAFEEGDELFEAAFNHVDGGGAFVTNRVRFTRTPRADLTGPGEWANHVPARATGPNAQACVECHVPPGDGAGPIAGNVHRDPLHSADPKKFIQRNTPHVFSMAGPQRLAEEMTAALQGIKNAAKNAACVSGSSTKSLSAKGVSFGSIKATRTSTSPCVVAFNTSGVQGVDADLVVKPFQWKGTVAFVRDFARGAGHNELGMQGVEIVGDGVDGDFDGVKDEFSVGDLTAMAVYLAAQPRPTTKLELNGLGLLTDDEGEPIHLTNAEKASINRGASQFAAMKCATCHKPFMTVDNRFFTEPSQNPNYRDATFPAGQNPVARGLDPAHPIKFDITKDQPDNQILDAHGNVVFRLGSFRRVSGGKALVELYGDLKRHDLGADVAENIDEAGTGASTFLTENLWGVGSTSPYLHDGRATTLTEAIKAHGGEGAAARAAFNAGSAGAQTDLLNFLNNLVLFFQ